MLTSEESDDPYKRTKHTFHPVQGVLFAAEGADAVWRVERSMSLDEVVPFQPGYSLQSVNVLQKHARQNAQVTRLNNVSCLILFNLETLKTFEI